MQGFVESHAKVLGEVFAVAESIESWDGRGLPLGAEPRLWRAVDRLKRAGAPAPLLASAERIGLTLCRLQATLLRSRADVEVEALKRELAGLGREWLGHLPMALSQVH
jgi:hypothetical protein